MTSCGSVLCHTLVMEAINLRKGLGWVPTLDTKTELVLTETVVMGLKSNTDVGAVR